MCGIVAALPAYQSVAGDGQPLPALPGPPLAAAALLRQPAQAERVLRDLLDEVEAVLQALGAETANVELLRDRGARQVMAATGTNLME